MIEPVEYVLSRQKRLHTVVYVPILKLLSELLKREEVLHELRVNRPVEQSGHFTSCLDGDYFKRNQILSHEDVSLCITLKQNCFVFFCFFSGHHLEHDNIKSRMLF